MRFLTLVGALLLTFSFSSTAFAQSPAELRAENERLRAENERLTVALNEAGEQLAKLQKMVDELQTRVAALEAAPPSAPSRPAALPPPPPEPVSVDESKAQASPRALLFAVRTACLETMKDKSLGEATSAERRHYFESLHRWKEAETRRSMHSVDWVVTMVGEPRMSRSTAVLSLQAIDPVHGTLLGEVFPAVIEFDQLRRLANDGIDETTRLHLRGVTRLDLAINESREKPGPFNRPLLIAPFVEFAFHVEVKSLTVHSETAP